MLLMKIKVGKHRIKLVLKGTVIERISVCIKVMGLLITFRNRR